MKSRLEIVREFDEKALRACIGLDALVYRADYQVDFEHEAEIDRKNPRTKTLCWLGDTLVGYIAYFPLTPAAYDRFLTATECFDLSVTVDDIMAYDKNHLHDMYISSIVIHPEHQGKMLGLVLMRGLMLALRELVKEGYRLGRLGGTGVSSAGVHQLKTYMGMRIVREVSPTEIAMESDCTTAINLIDEYMGFEFD